MVKVTCLTCKTAALRDPNDVKRNAVLAKFASGGAVNCRLTPHSFFDITHTCDQYTPAIAAIVASRVAWAEKAGLTENRPMERA